MHMGRSWSGHPLEDECPCPQEACGLIDWEKALDECPQHAFDAAKTMRQMHPRDSCPANVLSHVEFLYEDDRSS